MMSIPFVRKRVMILITILLLISAAFGAVADGATKEDLIEVFELLEANHVSGINEAQLSDAAIRGMIEVLDDPYTEYYSAEEWQEYEESLNRQYAGVGMRVGFDDQGFYVVEVFPDSPAHQGGVMRGDYILAVDGENVRSFTLNQLVERIQGPPETTVKLKIQRGTAIKEIELTRAKIQIPIVTSHWFTDGIGYIQLSSFTDDAGTLFREALDSFPKTELRGLIFDLRGNPGGYLLAAKEIAEQFIKEGVLINTKDRNNVNRPVKITKGRTVSYPVVVLVDGGSASASEVVAGALQDYQLATIIGTKTFGKGTVQSLIPLRSGGMLKVTFEEYLTPKFRSVNGAGLTPDIEVQGSAAQLVTALHTLSVKQIQILATRNTLTINDVEVFDSFPFQSEGNQVYVHSRFLAAMVDGEIAWNDRKKAVEIRKNHQTVTFPTSSNKVKWDGGLTFIDLDHFQSVFPGFEWSLQGEEIKMTFVQGE